MSVADNSSTLARGCEQLAERSYQHMQRPLLTRVSANPRVVTLFHDASSAWLIENRIAQQLTLETISLD
jgi:hypothetical protein